MASNKILHSVMRFAKSAGFKTFRIESYSELQQHSASSNKQQKNSWFTSDSANDSSTTFSTLLSSSDFNCISTRWKITTIYKHLLTTCETSTTICEYHLIYHHRIYSIHFSFIYLTSPDLGLKLPHQLFCLVESQGHLEHHGYRGVWNNWRPEW